MYEHNTVLLAAFGAVALIVSAGALGLLPNKISAKYPGGIPKNLRWVRASSAYLGFALWLFAMLILAFLFEVFYPLIFIWFAPELLSILHGLLEDEAENPS